MAFWLEVGLCAPFLCSVLGFFFCLTRAHVGLVCVMSVSEFLLEAAFYRPHARPYTVTLTQ